MSLPFLIYCSLLKKAQYRQLRDLSDVHYGAVDMTGVDQAMREGVEKRLTLAQEFLAFSESLLSSGTGSEIANRNAVSRAYYAVHHAVRALLLFEERGDVGGHRESIEAVYALLKRNPAVRSKLGNTEEFRASFLDLLDRWICLIVGIWPITLPTAQMRPKKPRLISPRPRRKPYSSHGAWSRRRANTSR